MENPSDLVRQEIAESLRRSGVRVFPLLVNGAEMPAEEDVPEPLKALCHRQSFDLTVRHWANDVAQLVQTLKRVPNLADAGAREATEATGRLRAEWEAQRREAEERAAKVAAQRAAAVEEAKIKADEAAADVARRRVETEARRKAAEQQVKKSADEGARGKVETEVRRGSEEEARRGAAKKEPAPIRWINARPKWVVGIILAVIVGTIQYQAHFSRAKRSDPAPPTPAAPEEKPSAAPRAPAAAWFERAIAALDPDENLRGYTEAIRLKPDYAEAYNNRGIARQAKGDLDGAMRDYDEAIRLKPDYASAFFNRADLWEKKGKQVNAIADFEKYLDLGGGIRDGDQAQVEQRIQRLKKNLASGR